MDYTKKVGELVRKNETDYINGQIQLSKYVTFSQYENIERIDAYSNSKHISGDTDSLGREKPFFNIVTAAVNIWYRATDIDRKNIRIKSTKFANVLFAFVATLKLQEWMRKAKFGVFLNEWGRALAKYGSAVVKFVDLGDNLIAEVVPWNRLISDTVNFRSNPKIEKFYLTEGELKNNPNYDKKQVEDLIANKSTRKNQDGQQKDNKSDYFEVYEVNGYFPRAYRTGEEKDKEIYEEQLFVMSFQLKDDSDDEYDDYCLFKGKKEKDNFMITHLIKEDGREQSIGAVEHLFDTQWMQNHSVKAIKDQLDLASKLIYQTADGNFVGQNVLTSLENGDILIHAPNAPLSLINNTSHDVGSLKTLADMFYLNGQRITGTTDAISGQNMPSGTSYSLGQMLNNESHDLFEIMTENKGLAIVEMMTEFIIPHLKTKLDTKEEIAEILSEENIQYIDSIFIPNEARRRVNKQKAEEIFNGLIASPADYQAEEEKIKSELGQLGNQRFIKPDELDEKTWNDVLKDIEWEIEVVVTNEGTDKKATLQTLTTVLQTIASNPAVLQDPNMKMIFNKILEETGTLSAIQLSLPKPTPQPTSQGGGGIPKSVGELLTKTADKTA